MKKQKMSKLIAFFLSVIFVANVASPTAIALSHEIAQGMKELETGPPLEGNAPLENAAGLDDITIPDVPTNPYSAENNHFILPIYSTRTYEYLRKYGQMFTSYGNFYNRTEERSQYYTGSLLTLTDRADLQLGGMTVTSDLPYTENRALMFHPELTLTGHWAPGEMRGTLRSDQYENIGPNGSSIWEYLDSSQTKMTVSGNMILGNGDLTVFAYSGTESQRYENDFTYVIDSKGYKTHLKELDPGETYNLSVTFPLTPETDRMFISYYAWSSSAITDPHAVLIDDEKPYVKDLNFELEKGLRDDEADLILTLELNEGIRFTSDYELEKNFAESYIMVRLWNSTQGKSQTVKLYLQKVDGSNKVVFRGNVGKLHYCNFNISDIASVHIPKRTHRPISGGFLDLADEMVVGVGKVKEYNNGLVSVNSVYSSDGQTAVSNLSDHAGNDLDLRNLENWGFGRFSSFRFYADSVEAEEIYIYNDKTLGVELGTVSEDTATDSDMFVGVGKDMTVYVYTDRVLEEQVWKQIYITLNILDANGAPLKVYPTSAVKYTNNEVYADGVKTGTLLKFENIRLSSEMSLDVPEGEEPRVKVLGMGSDYTREETGFPTVYPYVNDPDNIMYADFTPPEISVRKTVETSEDPNTETAQKRYKVSTEIAIEDVNNYSRIAGLVGEKAYIGIGGGVERETKIRYLLSTDPNPPQEDAAYLHETWLVPDKMVTLGGFTMLNNRSVIYVHILVESGGIYINDLTVDVEAYDLVQNKADTDPYPRLEYLIDEIAPIPSFVSKAAVAEDNNSTIRLLVNVKANDHTRVDRIQYCFATDRPDDSAEWQVAVIEEFGNNVNATIEKKYGDPNAANPDVNKVYSETLWIKAVDSHGNESEPIGSYIRLSLQKPVTSVHYTGDPNEVSRNHQILVSGPEASLFDGSDAYTRVTLTPLDDPTYSYITLVKTGDKNVDVLALKGLTWYRVKLGNNSYEEVSDPVLIDEGFVSHELLEGLLYCYGEMKVSFENGYGNMTPAVGALSATANAGSYFADPNYYTVRYASSFDTEREIHGVDFGAIIDCAIPFNSEEVVIQVGGKTVVPDADAGAAPYLFNQQYKGVNPMRNAQIHFSLSNLANPSYGLLDLDFASSYAELVKVGENGEADLVVATQNGLWATTSQYFTIGNTMDNGEYFPSGAYYLRVTVVSGGGSRDVYESSRIVLDAQTADAAGVWEYSYKTVANITQITDNERYQELVKTADGQAYTDIGIAVLNGGEVSRDRFFATYTYGVKDLSVVLSLPDSVRTYEGLVVGEVEGYKLWNSLSNPTDAQISARRFEQTDGSGTLVRQANTNIIYTSETIPQGISGFTGLYLIKGTNTFCYQVKMKNGYVSPVRQFTVTVTDEAPAFSISIDSYQPSVKPSQIDGVINADHVRYFVDTAYSMNGSGEVKVDLWSRYDMNLGLLNENQELTEGFTTGSTGELKLLYSGLKVEEYADFTENSYTVRFPDETLAHCSAVFVATDEYGGLTMIAPQLGDMDRLDVNAGVVGNAHEIDISYYGSYFNDPYVFGDGPFSWRILYHQPVYFGAQLLALETYLVENTPEGEIRVKDIQSSPPDLRYNQFNIHTNNISLDDGVEYGSGSYREVEFDNNYNQELVLLSDATVTLSGGYLNEPITLTFLDGDVVTLDENGLRTLPVENKGKGNTVGYMHGNSWIDNGTPRQLSFYIANPPSDATHVAGDTVTLNYVFRYSNIYGDQYEKTGTVTLTYIDYAVRNVEMTESGAKLAFSFEAKDLNNAGIERTGKFNNGNYEVTVPDYFGGNRSYPYEVSNQTDPETEITYQKFTNTAQPVTVTLKSPNRIYVDITDYEVMEVEYRTDETVVTVYQNTRLSYRYLDSNGDEKMYFIDVNNIFEPSPKVTYSYDLEDYNTANDGTKYRYGSVTVYLTDSNFVLRDRYTGETPTFTFLPGGEQTYVFQKEDIIAIIGDEEVELREDVIVRLPVVLYEVPELEFSVEEDTETPNVQVKAYSKRGEAYSDSKLLLQLTNIRNSTVFPALYGYERFEYIGNRANMTEILDRLGWSNSYRFTVETVDSSNVRLFIKEGLYAEAPDFNTGISDAIDGVLLNSKLLTVSKNAKFTLFVVDRFNNASSVAFNITNISEAPVPSVVKVPQGYDSVRLYVIAPDGVAEEDLKILSPEPKVDTNTQSSYYLKKYVEIRSNDDYDILYELKYNGSLVTDTIKGVSVTEISLDEITMLGQNWSANKASEATASEITVDIKFSHEVTELRALTAYDGTKVTFSVAGNTVKVTYTDNHPSIGFTAIAANNTYVNVTLDQISNVDKTAPIVTLVSDELAPDGRSLTLILSVNERTSFKEGNGRIGEEMTDPSGNKLYHYTIRISANGEYTYTFADMSGIQTTFTYTATKLVLDELDVLYNSSPADVGAVSEPQSLALKIGDKVYIKPERNVTAILTGNTEPILIAGGVWSELTIPEASGGISPYIIYTDEYGNVLTHQFASIEIPDSIPPEIIVSKPTYPVRVGTDRNRIEAELLGNFAAFDDQGGELILAVQFTDAIDVIGLTDVIYTATDGAGNTATAYGKLRITSLYEPEVFIGDKRIIRDEGMNLKSGEEVTLTINTSGVAYKVILANGKRTAAQMKGMEAVCDYTLEQTVELGTLKDGIYTILIVTEQRDYFRILIAVENF